VERLDDMRSLGDGGDLLCRRHPGRGAEHAHTVRDGIDGIDQRDAAEGTLGRASRFQGILDTLPWHGEQHRVAAGDRLPWAACPRRAAQPARQCLRLGR
jgi:hypothetical protein